ncbi:Phage minor capsid protein 2 [Caloramator mitchellensis]|uniref:Phage minor capsid protein 2 n=1 Tax=Caloramator mitchellensis TaxID=908809 RepID=A0A0R3JXW6_CALMK|nr:phage minor capsid protein [Caloramator mitchellensis]KRQ86046.1 Phage minor capsid protein 2 [Caloramator mitchellensis]
MPYDVEKQIEALVEIYRQGFLEVLKVLLHKESKKQNVVFYKDQLKQIMGILNQIDKEAAKWIQEVIPRIYQENYTQVLAYINKVGMQKDIKPEFAQVHQRAIDVIAQNMYDNLRQATQFAGRRINDYYRQAALEAAAKKYAAGQTVKDISKELQQKLLSQGLTGFKDKLGREWRIDRYAEMVARTTTAEIASVATLNTCEEAGIDLVRITTHYPTCEKCAPLQGKVFSISGKDKRYPKLEDRYRPPIHPNCRHSLQPYVREFDDNAEETERFSNTSLTKDPRNEKEKQAYKGMRDKVTIQSNRRKAREVLYNENAQLEDKVKAAERLKRSYEKEGKRPTGKDGSIIKQYEEYIKNKKETAMTKDDSSDIIKTKQRIKEDIANGKYNIKINIEKQNRHIYGTNEYEEYLDRLKKENKNYKPSILTANAQEIIDRYISNGEIRLNKHQEWNNRLYVECDKLIGIYIDKEGKEYKTNRCCIHFSKTGIHVVPIKPLKELNNDE